MSEVKDSYSKKKKSVAGAVPLSDIFFMTLHHWPWIILSVFMCVGAAYIYLLRTPNVYTESAEILIKDDQRGKSTGGEDFADLGLFQSNTNIQNEISNLMAKDLMVEVVRKLNLDYNYYHNGTFHDVVAYGSNLPVQVSVPGFPENGSFSMKLNVSKEGQVSIKDLKEGGNSFDKTFTGKLNDSIATPVGKIVVAPTSAYVKDEAVDLKVNKIPLSVAGNSYNARLAVTVSGDKGSSVLRLTMADQSPQRADDVLNALIGVYNDNWIRDKNQIAVSTSNFINERLGVIESELGHVDSDISTYKSANLIPDVTAAASMYMSQSQQNQAQILDVNNQLSMARYIRSYLTADGNHDQLLPANSGFQSADIQSLIGEYNERLLQRNALVAKSSDKNPLVSQLDVQLASQRQAIVRSIDNEIISLNTQLKSLRGSEAQTVSRLASNPNQAKNLLSVERQQKVKESLYLFLLQKREENELSQAFTAYNTRIVNRPGPSGMPATPNRQRILLFAFLIGLAIPFCVTYVKETSNRTVRGRKDVEHLAVPFLGEIPLDLTRKKEKSNKAVMAVGSGNRDIINEAFRVLRTNISFMINSVPGPKVVAITSFNPGSGKSFVTANVGMAAALKGKHVLIIDGDMRHCSSSVYVDNPKKGMADYLVGSIDDINSLVVKYKGCDNLSFLPVGSVPPNPTELLESPRFAQMLDTLKHNYDYILIDCPPIEVVADTQIIDQYADRTFFIVRAGLLERSMLDVLENLYEEKKYRNMAFILNGTRNDKGRHGFSHSYSYGYGYGYGYGYNYAADDKKK